MLFLASNGYRVIAHDLRGHGWSSQPSIGNAMAARNRGYDYKPPQRVTALSEVEGKRSEIDSHDN
jgi:pimeloyl-ACP methyl ester carboxylesterase